MQRRQFLKIAGTGGVIVTAVGAGAGGYVVSRKATRAEAPWKMSVARYPDPMRRALSWAILAPNPHNRQPWMVELESNTEATLRCDLKRLLPDTDPFDRQITIGLGCFLELFDLAARQDGYRAQIVPFPQGEPDDKLDARPIAKLQLIADPGIQPDPLFAYAPERRTNRDPYDTTREVTARDLDLVRNAAGPDVETGGVATGNRLQQLRTLTRNALRDEILDPVAFRESIDLMRIGHREIDANPDGISIRGPMVEALSLLGLLRREDFIDQHSSTFQMGLDMADEQTTTAMGFVWITTQGNTRMQQIPAGRAYMRIALGIAGLGLAMQPMSQALQEYSAMAPYYRQVHNLLTNSDDERVQMLARVGYAEQTEPAPRWALETRIMQS